MVLIRGSLRQCCIEAVYDYCDKLSDDDQLNEGDQFVCDFCGTGLILRDGAWDTTSRRADWPD